MFCRTGLSRLQDNAFTRAICSSSRESIRGAECALTGGSVLVSCSEAAFTASETQPLVPSQSRFQRQDSAPGHGLKCKAVENELERIASESLRINGVAALRSFRQLRKPVANSSTLSIPSAMKNTSADSDAAQGLISVSTEHPHGTKCQQRSFASNSIESDKRKSNCGQNMAGGGGGPAGFHRPNVGLFTACSPCIPRVTRLNGRLPFGSSKGTLREAEEDQRLCSRHGSFWNPDDGPGERAFRSWHLHKGTQPALSCRTLSYHISCRLPYFPVPSRP